MTGSRADFSKLTPPTPATVGAGAGMASVPLDYAVPVAALPSLRRNFSWTLAGNVIYAACQWGVLVVLAKYGDMETVGRFAWGLAVSSPIMLFANLQLREIQATDARRQFRFGHYLALRGVCILAGLSAIVAVAALTSPGLQAAAVVVLVGLGKAFDGLSDVAFGLFQQREQMKPVSAALVVNGVVTLVAVAAAMAVTGSVVWAAAGFALGSAVAAGVAAAQAGLVAGGVAELRPRWEGSAVGGLLRLSLPLGVVALMISTNTNMSRYFVEHYLGAAALGAFAAILYVMQAGTTVTTALAQSSSARLARRYADGDVAGFCRLLFKLLGSGVVLGLVGVAVAAAAGAPLLSAVYRPEYAGYARLFTWVMAAAAVAYVATFLNSAMIASRSIRAQGGLFAVVLATGFVTSWYFVPRYGLTGAAWATGLTLLVQLAGAGAVVARAVWRLGRGRAKGTADA